jgi:hypothetical protein
MSLEIAQRRSNPGNEEQYNCDRSDQPQERNQGNTLHTGYEIPVRFEVESVIAGR